MPSNPAFQFADHVAVQQQLAGRADGHLAQLALLLQFVHQPGRLVGGDVGAAHQVGQGEAAERPEPRHHQHALGGIAGPQLLDALQHLEMTSPHLLGHRLQHLPAAHGERGRRLAQDERLAPGGRGLLVEEQLGQPPLARLHGVAVEQGDGAHRLLGAGMEAHRLAMLDGPAHLGQAVQAHGDDARRHEVAGRGQLLAAHHVLVLHAGQVDGRALASMGLLGGLVVVLDGAHPHALPAGQPFRPRRPP